MRRLFCLVTLLMCGVQIHSSTVTMQYDNVTLCAGGSFNLADFVENQVVVPVDCRVLGWQEDVPSIITLPSDTVLHLAYVEKSNEEVVHLLSFALHVRDRPKIQLEPSRLQICMYETFPVVHCSFDNADQTYFQQVTTGVRKSQLDEFGPAISEGDNRFWVVATNDQCAESVQEELIVEVVDPRQFSLSASLPPTQYSICGDSVLLCDYFELQNVRLYYKGESVRRLPASDYSSRMEWLLEDSFTNCDSMIRESYTNTYTIRLQTEEPTCHTVVDWKETNRQEFICSGKSVRHALSYSCSSDLGVIYWGAEWPIENVRFVPLSSGDLPTPVVQMEDSYNMDTYLFPNRGSAYLCWTGTDVASYRVELLCRVNEEEVMVLLDTIEVESCQKNPPLVQFVCDKGEPRVTVASMEELVDVRFSSVELVREEPVLSDVPSYYNHVWSFGWNESDPLQDTLESLVMLSALNCTSDTVQREMWIKIHGCTSDPRLYYGAYRSPSAILQYKKECISHQCSNVSGQEAPIVTYHETCYGDTIFLKLKKEGSAVNGKFHMFIQSDYDMVVISPSHYEEKRRNEFLFYGTQAMNPIVAFVPERSGEVRGELEGIPFAFSIQVAEKTVESSYHVCSGDTIDLNEWIQGDRKGLSWNVQETVIAPTHDEEYYLYGFTENGCLVDEHVDLLVDYPLWYQASDESFCVESWVDKEELLHSNARRTEWYRGDSLMDDSQTIYLGGADTYRVVLYADCDSAEYRFRVNEKRCDEEKYEFSVTIPNYFTPDGDGRNDEWLVQLPLNEGVWQCTIYDRFGKVLAEYRNECVRWNGYYQGNRMPATDYWYVILHDDELFRMGHFTLR